MRAFQPGDVISCGACGSPMMRRVVGRNEQGYVVENLRGDKRHALPAKVAEACWERIGGAK